MMVSVLVAALAVALVLIVVSFFSMSRRDGRERAEDPRETLNPESLSIYHRIRRLANEVSAFSERPTLPEGLRGIANEAAGESKRILGQLRENLRIRQELKRLALSGGLVERDIANLTSSLDAATSDTERSSFQRALDAKKMEQGHYGELRSVIEHIDANIRNAEASLSELKGRIAAAMGASAVDNANQEDLRDAIGRMRALSLTVEEARPWLTEAID